MKAEQMMKILIKIMMETNKQVVQEKQSLNKLSPLENKLNALALDLAMARIEP